MIFPCTKIGNLFGTGKKDKLKCRALSLQPDALSHDGAELQDE